MNPFRRHKEPTVTAPDGMTEAVIECPVCFCAFTLTAALYSRPGVLGFDVVHSPIPELTQHINEEHGKDGGVSVGAA